MINKFKHTAPFITIAIYMLVMLTLVSAKRKDIECSNIKVNIKDKSEYLFIEDSDVVSIINENSDRLMGQPIEKINIDKLESLLSVHPSIKKADVYRNIRGDLSVRITQRKPLMRVIDKNRESYYIDIEGKVMPLSQKYTAHVIIVNGNFNEPYAKNKELNVIKDENASPKLKQLFTLATYIYNNEFLKSQIEQIYVSGSKVELVPRVGTHIIEFGHINDIEEKFMKLDALYKQGLPANGWNKYKTINLEYKNQVICTKR